MAMAPKRSSGPAARLQWPLRPAWPPPHVAGTGSGRSGRSSPADGQITLSGEASALHGLGGFGRAGAEQLVGAVEDGPPVAMRGLVAVHRPQLVGIPGSRAGAPPGRRRACRSPPGPARRCGRQRDRARAWAALRIEQPRLDRQLDRSSSADRAESAVGAAAGVPAPSAGASASGEVGSPCMQPAEALC